jgi:hypothetical protein
MVAIGAGWSDDVAMAVRAQVIEVVARHHAAVADEHRQQRAIDRVGIQLLGRDALLEGAVGNFAGVPHHGSARVNDQEAGRTSLGTIVRLPLQGRHGKRRSLGRANPTSRGSDSTLAPVGSPSAPASRAISSLTRTNRESIRGSRQIQQQAEDRARDRRPGNVCRCTNPKRAHVVMRLRRDLALSSARSITYPETRTPAANSGRWGEPDVESKVLDAISKLGSDAGLVAFDKKIGAEVLVERAILQHVVDHGQQRGRHRDGSLFGSASSFEAEELCLIIGPLGTCWPQAHWTKTGFNQGAHFGRLDMVSTA